MKFQAPISKTRVIEITCQFRTQHFWFVSSNKTHFLTASDEPLTFFEDGGVDSKLPYNYLR